MITNPHRQQAYPKCVWTEEIKPSTNSRSVQCFNFLDLSSFCFIYFPHRLVKYVFIHNLVDADSKKIRICRRINAQSRIKRVLEAKLNIHKITNFVQIQRHLE